METKNLFEDSIKELKEAIETSEKEEVQNFETFMTQHMFNTMISILDSPIANTLALNLSEKLGETNAKELFEAIAIVVSKISCSSIMMMKDIFTRTLLSVNQGMLDNLNNTTLKDINVKLTDHAGVLKVLNERIKTLEDNQ